MQTLDSGLQIGFQVEHLHSPHKIISMTGKTGHGARWKQKAENYSSISATEISIN